MIGTEKKKTSQVSRTCKVLAMRYLSSPLGADRDAPEQVQFVEHLAGTEHDAGEGVFGDHHRKAGLFPQEDVQVAQERPPSCQDDPLVDDVGGELGRRPLKADPDRLDDGVYRL